MLQDAMNYPHVREDISLTWFNLSLLQEILPS